MEDILLEHMGKGFILMLIISMPCVLMAAAVGLVVGILQAVTQIQEQTIAAAPKIFAVFLVIMIGGGTFTQMVVNYFQESAHMAFQVITKQEEYALAPGDSLNGPGESNKPARNLKEAMGQESRAPYQEKNEAAQSYTNSKGLSSPRPNIAELEYIHKRK